MFVLKLCFPVGESEPEFSVVSEDGGRQPEAVSLYFLHLQIFLVTLKLGSVVSENFKETFAMFISTFPAFLFV